MRKFSVFTTITIAVLMLGAATASAQTPGAKPPPTYEQVIVNTWKNLHNKILTMAKDTVFPEAKLGYKPHPDSRSMYDEFRHVTIGLEMTTALGKGEKWWHVPKCMVRFCIEVQDDIEIDGFVSDGSTEVMAARRLTDYLEAYFIEEVQRHA